MVLGKEELVAEIDHLLSELDDIGFHWLRNYSRIDLERVKASQQELAKARRALLKARGVLERLDLRLGGEDA